MSPSVDVKVIEALSGFDAAFEVGIGRRTTAATQLAADGTAVVASDVVASDVVAREIPQSVTFVEVDVHDLADATDPIAELRTRAGEVDADGSARIPDADGSARIPDSVDLVYALNLPAELQLSTVDVAEALDAVVAFTTLGFEEPVVDVARVTAGTDTLYVADDGRWDSNSSEPGRR